MVVEARSTWRLDRRRMGAWLRRSEDAAESSMTALTTPFGGGTFRSHCIAGARGRRPLAIFAPRPWIPDRFINSLREIINYHIYNEDIVKYNWQLLYDNNYILFLKHNKCNFKIKLEMVPGKKIEYQYYNILEYNVNVEINEVPNLKNNNYQKRMIMSQNEPKRMKLKKFY